LSGGQSIKSHEKEKKYAWVESYEERARELSAKGEKEEDEPRGLEKVMPIPGFWALRKNGWRRGEM